MSALRGRVERLSARQLALLRIRLRDELPAAGAGRTGVEQRQQLVAWVLPGRGTEPDADALRRALEQVLPEYMIPSAFVFLDTLPTTPNGKVDRLALPRPEAGEDPASDDAFVAPTNPVERTLAAIWADVLGFEEVGIHDDFFEMGGDSLLSIRVIARAGEAGIEITPELFVERPTIAEQAAAFATVGGTERSNAAGDEAPGKLVDLDDAELGRIADLLQDLEDD